MKLGIQPKAATKPARPRTAGAKPFFAASSLFRECKKNVFFRHQMDHLPLLFTYVYLLLTLVFIGGKHGKWFSHDQLQVPDWIGSGPTGLFTCHLLDGK